MTTRLAAHWWALALRGVLAILFGILAFAWPGLTLNVVVLLIGAYLLLDGIFALAAAALGATDGRPWGAVLLEGFLGIAAGIVALSWPGIAELALVYLVAAWAIITGVLELVAAIRLRRAIDDEWWLILSGVASIAFGVFLAIAPVQGAVALIWLVGAYAIVFGVLLISLAFRVRSWGRARGTSSSGPLGSAP
jgi:uncharacterized membrane protein HdeD (DUF308 family)